MIDRCTLPSASLRPDLSLYTDGYGGKLYSENVVLVLVVEDCGSSCAVNRPYICGICVYMYYETFGKRLTAHSLSSFSSIFGTKLRAPYSDVGTILALLTKQNTQVGTRDRLILMYSFFLLEVRHQ